MKTRLLEKVTAYLFRELFELDMHLTSSKILWVRGLRTNICGVDANPRHLGPLAGESFA